MAFGDFVQSLAVNPGVSTVATGIYPSNNTAGNILVACMESNTTGEGFTISDTQANTWIEQALTQDVPTAFTQTVWLCLKCAGGANTITITSTISIDRRLVIGEYIGPGILNKTAVALGSGTSLDSGATASTSFERELILGFCATRTASVRTAGSGFTVRSSAGNRISLEDKFVTAFGTQNATYTLAGSLNWICSVVTIGELLQPVQGSFSLSGQTALFAKNSPLTVGLGSFTFSGQDVSLFRGNLIPNIFGSFSFSGQDTTLLFHRILLASVGLFVVEIIPGDSFGNYFLTGQNIGLERGNIFLANVSSFSLSGQNVNFPISRFFQAVRGNFLFSGQNINFIYPRLNFANFGLFELTGQNADFILTARPVFLGQELNLGKALIGKIVDFESTKFLLVWDKKALIFPNLDLN